MNPPVTAVIRKLRAGEGRNESCGGHWYCGYVPRYAVTENGRTRYLCDEHHEEARIWRAGIAALRESAENSP